MNCKTVEGREENKKITEQNKRRYIVTMTRHEQNKKKQ
jgi:hypothetical protein